MKKHLVFLAAGLSRRFGAGNKLLYPYCGMPLYRHTLDKLEQLQDETTRLLVMTNTPEIQRHCEDRAIPCKPSPNAHLGIAHTLHSALAHIPEDEICVCFVADQPNLQLSTIRGFLKCCKDSGKGIGCLSRDRQGGNPVWFYPQYRRELLALSGDVGGRRVVNAHPEDVFHFPASEKDVEDFDLLVAFH